MIGVGGGAAAAAVFIMHLTGCTALATTLPYLMSTPLSRYGHDVQQFLTTTI